MKVAANFFLLPGFFFLVVGIVYGFVTDFKEWVGFPVILLTAGLALMVGIYFKMLEKRHGLLPEDIEDHPIEVESGEQGVYAPWSWWPLVLAGGAAIGFTALAAGWWIMVPATIVTVIGLIGWVMEFSLGRHKH